MIVNLLLTGDELMSGDTVDSNSAMIARALRSLGWTIRKKLTVGDTLDDLIAALRLLSTDCDVLLVNGGLGPTVDDLTAEALAKTAQVSLREHPQALEHLQQWCTYRGIALNAANRKQALLPDGCTVVANPIGSAVGFALSLHKCRVICTPGVPRELEAMLNEEIVPALRAQFPVGHTRVERFTLFGIGESSLQQRINDAIPAWPDDIALGFRAGFPQLELKLTTHSDAAHAKLQTLLPQLRPLIEDFTLGGGDVSMAMCVIDLLKQRGKKITVAESCTGGQLAAAITQIAGASQVFDAGFITYSNTIKEKILNVSSTTLATDGAVSAAVVEQMARGALQRSGADYAIAVSGIAGPDGGSAEKPVGTVWIAWGSTMNLQSRLFHIRFPRVQFQHYVSWIGLDLIRRELLGIHAEASYLRAKK